MVPIQSTWLGATARARAALPEALLLTLISIVGVQSVAYAAGAGDGVARALVADGIYIALDVAGVTYGLWAARSPGLPDPLRRAWLLIAAGCLFNAGGDVIWTAYQVAMGEPPYPSAADVLYLGFYPLITVGLLLIPAVRSTRLADWKLVADVLMVGIAGGIITWDLFLGPAAAAGDADALTQLITIASPVGDIVLLFGIARVLLTTPVHGGGRSLLVLMLGIVTFLGADIAYAAQQFSESFVSGGAVDVAYTLASLSLPVAAYLRRRDSVDRRDDVPGVEARWLVPALRAALPLVAVVGASALLLFRTATGTREGDEAVGQIGMLGLHVGVLTIMVLVGLRGSLTVRERVEAERRAMASAERYRALVEQASDGIVVTDEAGRIQTANARLGDLLGVQAASLIGRPYLSLFAEPDAAGAPIARGAMRPGTVVVEERRLRRGDGGTLDAELSVGRLSDRRFQAIVRDLGARREAEAERARMLSALEQTAECVIITDPAGTIVYVNPAFERVTGYTRDDAVGATPRLIRSGAQPPAFYAGLRATLDRGETWSGEMVNRRKDGSPFRAFASISPVRDETGQVVSFVAVERDVTRERELETSLRQAQKMEAVGQLAGGIAHDFNNLITGIRGFAELLRDDLATADPRRQDVEQIMQASDRATDLTRGLLAFGRRAKLDPRVIDLGALIEGIVPLMRRLVGEHIAMDVDARPGWVWVRADPGGLEQVVVNLVVNARDAMPLGGRLTISVAAENVTVAPGDLPNLVPGPYATLAVGDDGSGMDEATLAHAFEPFFTTKAKGSGTGLGLASVDGIVSMSSGRIRVESALGRGTRFTIYLPAVVAPAPEAAAPDEPQLRGEGGFETVLLAEDEDAVRAVAIRVLEGAGYRVLAAASGADALELADAHAGRIDLLLSDVIMPGMVGPTLAERLVERRPDARILFMSGHMGDVLRPVGVREHALLEKPFTFDTLREAVRAALDEPAAPVT